MSDEVRLMNEADLELVLAWRNHDSVRKYMYSTSIIGWEEHLNWFNQASMRSDQTLLIYEHDRVPSGYVNFTARKTLAVRHWGFYLAPEAARGTGMSLGKAALDYAFGELNVSKVIGEALAFNNKSIKFHEKLGFENKGVLEHRHSGGSTIQDVVTFSLTKAAWTKFKGGLNV